MSVEVRVQSSSNAPEQIQCDSDCLVVDVKCKTTADMTRMSSAVASEDTESPVKNKEKRMVHNEVERRRKVKINNHIFTLAKLLPNKDGKKWSKNEVLTKAIEYVQEIKESHEKLLIGKMDEVQADEFKNLKRRIEELEKQNSQYVKLLEIAGFPSTPSGGVKPQCDKLFNKLDPSTIIMSDDGEISVVSPSRCPDSTALSGKRLSKSEIQSSPKKQHVNGNVRTQPGEGVLSSPNSSFSGSSTPLQLNQWLSDNQVSKTSAMVSTATKVNLNAEQLETTTVTASLNAAVSNINITGTKEHNLGNINGGVTAVTHALQGGPIMSTSQKHPQLQMQPAATVVPQIPMLNFGGAVNLMQGTAMQPVLTINEQGIQVIQMMAAPNGQMVVNSNGASTPNLLLTSNATPAASTIVQPGNSVHIDSTTGSTQTLISADSAAMPVIQQTVCGGSLIAQGTQYMTTNPQVHLMTNSPPVIRTPANGNVMLGASVQGANTVLTLNSNPNSTPLPSALMLPNGQIIPVVREPQLPLIYQNQTQFNGGLLMSSNPARNSSCTVFSTKPITTLSNSLNTNVTNNVSNEVVVCSDVATCTVATTKVSAANSITEVRDSTSILNSSSTSSSASVGKLVTDNNADVVSITSKGNKSFVTNKTSGGAKNKSKRLPANRSQRNIKPKPTADISSGGTSAAQPSKSPVLSDKSEQPGSAADAVTVSTNVSSTTMLNEITTNSIIEVENSTKGKECSDSQVTKNNTAQKNDDAPPPFPVVVPPNTMTDILAQATESIFANSMSDISNSPNPTYFGNCSNANSDNVDFLNINEATQPKNDAQISTSFTNALSSSTTMTQPSESSQIGARNCSITMNEIANHNMNGKCEGGSRSHTADILSDLVGEVYRAANANTPNPLISACVSSFERQSHQQQSQCDSNMANSNINERLATDSAKTKRCGTEEENLSGKRMKLTVKPNNTDLTLSATTAASSSSVSFLSVSQLASSASASSGNVSSTSSSSCTVTLSNAASTSVMPFSIDTGTSNENSPLCSISPLLNSPSKSNDLFALSSPIDHTFSAGSIVSANNSNIISSITGSSGNVTSSVNTVVSTSINMPFPGLSNAFGSNNTLPTSVSASATFALPDLNNLNSGGNTDVHENYRTLSYQHAPVQRGNVNGISFQTNDTLGFSLAGSSTSAECFLDKNIKTPSFDYTSRSRQNHSLHSHTIATSPSAGSGVAGSPSNIPFTSNLVNQTGQFNRIHAYSSIPLSHPVSPRHQQLAPSPVNMDSNHTDDMSCGANKNKSVSPRQGTISGPESNIGQSVLMSPSGMNSVCLQRSGSVRQLSSSTSGHQDVNQLNQQGIGCSIADQSQQQRQPHSYSNGNHRVHSVSRQSPKICSVSSSSPISTPDIQGHSPISHRGNSNTGNGNASSTNASPKMSPIGHNITLNQTPISRSSHSVASGNHQPTLSSAPPFIHQRSPNLDPPLITSFATESLTMQNVCNNNTNLIRRDGLFPPGQKQLTHPPLSMPSSANSCAPPRGAITYSAESLIQSRDNNNHHRPNCARENNSTSTSNTVLRQTAPIHNSGTMASPHTLPFMHGSHLNRAPEDNQQVGFPYFPFQQTPEQASHLIPLKPNHQMNHTIGGKNHLQNTQPQPNFSFSLMPTSSHQANNDVQQHLPDQQSHQQQHHQRHGNYLSVGNYSQVPPPPMPGLEGMTHKDIPRPPMTFPCMPPFSSTQPSGDQTTSNIRNRHSASFLTTPTNRDQAIGSSTFPESYSAVSSSLAPLSSNAMVVGNGGLVPLSTQNTEKVSGYKQRTQNANKQDSKMSKSKQSQASKKKNQQYQIEEINLSNSIFETGRSTTPYFAIPSLSPPRNNEGPTYIPNTNPLFNRSRAGKGNSGLSAGATGNHSTTGDSYNALFHARPQTGFNLNFQAPSFTVNHLHGSAVGNDNNNTASSSNQIGSSHMNSAAPPPPLVSSSSSHVPNFNLSNIFPDINANNESLNISPIKFHGNPILPPPPTPGSSQTGIDGHTLQHSQSGSLYHTNRNHHPPPPPPVIHNGMTINSILSHNPHSFDGRPQMPVGINNTMTPWTWTSNIQ